LVRIFESPVEQIYHQKSVTDKKSFKYDLWKRLLNSIYGSFYEKYPSGGRLKTGLLFNPIYATEITAETRLDLYRVMRDNHRHVIAAATDGLLFDQDPELGDSKDLGAWGSEGSGKLTVLRSGVYLLNDKFKSRGVEKGTFIKTPYGRFDNIFDYIRAEPDLLEYPITRIRPRQLGECITQSKTLSISDLNLFEETPSTVQINGDYKRVYPDAFTSGGELFERHVSSYPLLLL